MQTKNNKRQATSARQTKHHKKETAKARHTIAIDSDEKMMMDAYAAKSGRKLRHIGNAAIREYVTRRLEVAG